MVKGWLKSAMDKEVRSRVKYATTACEIWEELEERFAKGSAPRVYELRRTMTLLRQEKLSKRLMQMRERDQLYDFLMGLDDVFGTVKTHILSMTPVISLGHAYHLVGEVEQQRLISVMHKPTTEPVAFQTQSVRYNKEGTKRIDWRKKKLKCEHCQKMGHTEDKCYEIIGYPPDWGKKNKERKDNRGGPKAAQVVTTERPIPGLSMQQYERLMQQLKGDAELVVTILQSKPNMNMASKIIFTKPWVIDSGATAHITCDSALLIEERFTNQQPVKIPNGQNILVKSIGITELPNGVKDLTTRTLIGVGRHRDGLYLLEPIQDGVMEIKVDRSIDESIWHWRLGHASETKMKQIEPLSDVVIHIINRLPSKVIGNKTPYEKLMGKKPNYEHLRVFGCLVYVLKNKKEGKFDEKGRACVFMGYPSGQKGYKVYDTEKKEIQISRDVIFCEDEFPFKAEKTIMLKQVTPPVFEETEDIMTREVKCLVEQDVEETRGESAHEENHDVELLQERNTVSGSVENEHNKESRSRRMRHPPRHLEEYEVDLPPSITRFQSDPPSGNSVVYPVSSYLSYDKFSHSHKALLAAISLHREPKNFSQEVKHECWREAMKKEIEALEKNET
ncbi:uncharacterized protein LOC109810097 [Cajanus cajan]|uniref:uncharacterized protein LOC109810097 n=1 Tax=Cajanus cajan TaxID=3821 RepID=UPI00098DB3D5|nr:uncharacterized protein LOC109810097 [Cajanus cajan]